MPGSLSKTPLKLWGVWIGATLTLSACGGGSGGGSSTASAVGADQMVIQPIRVCDDTGTVCAQMDFLEAITDKIWAQAGIGVTFLTPKQLNSSTYLSIAPGSGSNSEFSQLAFAGGPGAFGRHPSSSRNSGPINMWFVDVIEAGSGLVQYGSAWIGLNGVLISDDIYSFNGGMGRIDVIAHEVGHNLGLEHDTLGAGGANNLMSDGSRRAIANSIGDIYPDGARLDQLNNAQIQQARRSGFLISAAGVAGLLAATPDQVPVAAADAAPVGDGDELLEATGGAGEPVLVGKGFESEDLNAAMLTHGYETAQVPEPGISMRVWLSIVGLGGFGVSRRRP